MLYLDVKYSITSQDLYIIASQHLQLPDCALYYNIVEPLPIIS